MLIFLLCVCVCLHVCVCVCVYMCVCVCVCMCVCVCVCLYSLPTSVLILDNYLSHSSLSERLTAEETQPMRSSGSQSCDRLLTGPPASPGTCPTTFPSPSTRTPPQTLAPSVALILISPLKLRLVVCL